MVINVKILLYLFECMSGLKINFDKSELLLTLEYSIKLEEYTGILNCQMGSWPIKYLGAPVSGGRLKIEDLEFIEEKQEKNLDGWQRGSMSLAGRKVLIDASLNSGIIYYMSMFRFCKTFILKLVKRQKCFF
jgi:hypothetical protein